MNEKVKNCLKKHVFIITSSFILNILFLLVFFKYGQPGLDNVSASYPGLYQVYLLAHQHYFFSGVDLLTSSGATIFSLRPNFLMYSPVFLLLFTCFKFSFKSLNYLMDVVTFLHGFFALFFCQLLAGRFFKIDKLYALLFGVLYVFSISMCNAYGCMSFVFVALLFPIMLYIFLISGEDNLSYSKLFLLSSIFVINLLSGYIPMSLMALVLAAIFSLCYFYFLSDIILNNKRIIKMFMPSVIACMVVAPLYLAIKIHLGSFGTTPHGLFFSAHQLAVLPSDIIAGVFPFFGHMLKPVESTIFFGFIPLVILLLFVFSFDRKRALEKRELMLFKMAFTLYVMSFLIIFGEYLRISDLFYYVAPYIGEMHIYQRYLILTNLFFSLFVVIALEYILRNHPQKLIKMTILISFLLTGFVCIELNYNLSVATTIFGFSQFLVIELMLLTLLLISFLIFDKNASKVITIFLVFIMSLTYFYQYQEALKATLPNPIIWDSKDELDSFLGFIRSYSNKNIIKYENISDVINETYIPRNLPWVVQKDIKLSNYMGYDMHLSVEREYSKYISTFGNFDWRWLRLTGCQYIIYNAKAYKKYKEIIDKYIVPSIHITLRSGDVVAKLKPEFSLYNSAFAKKVFDNGYIQVLHTTSEPQVINFVAKQQEITLHLKVTDTKTRLVLPFWKNSYWRLSINNVVVPFATDNDLYYHDFSAGEYDVKIYARSYLLQMFFFIYIGYWVLWLLVLYMILWRRKRFNFMRKLAKQ